MKVAIIGASPKPERYAYMAFKKLLEKGHEVYLIHPKLEEIEGHNVFHSLKDIPVPIDTITLYVGPDTSSLYQDDIISLRPRRVIFNPGAENPALSEALSKEKIMALEACTLVLLSTSQF